MLRKAKPQKSWLLEILKREGIAHQGSSWEDYSALNRSRKDIKLTSQARQLWHPVPIPVPALVVLFTKPIPSGETLLYMVQDMLTTSTGGASKRAHYKQARIQRTMLVLSYAEIFYDKPNAFGKVRLVRTVFASLAKINTSISFSTRAWCVDRGVLWSISYPILSEATTTHPISFQTFAKVHSACPSLAVHL